MGGGSREAGAGPGSVFRETLGWAGGDSHMNPISSGSQTPKRRWQEPQLPSQQWPGKGGRQGSGDERRWLLPLSPQSGGGGAAEGVLRAGPARSGGGGRGPHGFRARGGRRPRLSPRHLPLIAARRGRGRGALTGPKSAPGPGRRVCGPRARSARGRLQSPTSPSPGGARGSRDRYSRPPPIPAERRRAASSTPTPTSVTT